MASNTNNLGLLKKDPVADGNDTFNVRTMLNENWDKIDAVIGDVATPAAAMGLTKRTVGDALNVLANIGNLHVWQRVQTYAEEQHTYTLGEKATGVALATGTGAGYQQIWYCSDKITVSDSLEISLVSPSTVNFYSNTTTEEFMSAVAGKFIKYKGHGSEAGLTLSYAGVYFCPVDSAFGNVQYSQYEVYKGITNAQIVTAVTIPAGTTTDYLTSTDRNAYTEGTVDNTTITYLGQLGGGARIEVGSYVGTGTYGSSNPCSITLSKDSVIVFILKNGVFAGVLSIYDSIAGGFSLISTSAGSGEHYYSFLQLNVSASGNTISWWHKYDSYQLNVIGNTYTWVALAIG